LKKLLIVLVILCIPSVSFSDNVCVGPSASGDGSGDDWNNIKAISTLTGSNWVRGDTYYLKEGTYGSIDCTTAASGSTYVYIKKCADTTCQAITGYSSSDHDGQAVFSKSSDDGIYISSSYWDIDGVVGGGPESWESGHGIYITTSQGASHSNINIVGSSISHINIRHVETLGSTPNGDTSNFADAHIRASDTPAVVTDVLIEYCYGHSSDGVFIDGRGGGDNNWTIQYNKFEYNESSALSHAEAIQSDDGSNWIIRYNVWEDIEGTAVCAMGDNDSVKIYGNIFQWTADYPRTGQGGDGVSFVAGCGTSQTCTVYYYNNTFADYSDGWGSGGNAFLSCAIATSTISIKNNIWRNPSRIRYTLVPVGSFDYNAYYSSDNGGADNGEHSFTFNNDPFLNIENLQLLNTDGYGVNDTNYAAGDSAIGIEYNTDMLGTTRGSDNVWDMGAFEYGLDTPSASGVTSSGVTQ
jgi:hypothetical protein